MDVKEAVANAKRYIEDLFGREEIRNLGLEEVEFDTSAQEWLVTVGFSRPWDEPNILGQRPQRSYKVVRISDFSGDVTSVKNREVATT